MSRAFLRTVALAVGMVLAVAACGSAASIPATPSANATPAAATPAQASAGPSGSSVAAATPAPAASDTPVPTTTAPPIGVAPFLAGTWNGTWHDVTPDTASGGFVLTWTQAGSTLTGKIVVTGTPCITDGTISGKVTGTAISFGVVSGRISIAYEGTFDGTTMKGTYKAAATCADATGDWQATRK